MHLALAWFMLEAGMHRASLFQLIALGCLAAAMTACGGVVDDSPPASAGSRTPVTLGGGGGEGGGAAGSSDQVSSGGAAPKPAPATGGFATGGATSGGAANVGGAPSTECVPQSPNYYPETCTDLNRLRVVDPSVKDDGGDGSVSPGEGATISVTLQDTSGYGYSMYPYVAFSAPSGVTLGAPEYFYAIAACQSHPTSVHIQLSPYLTPTTVIRVTAQAAGMNQNCAGTPSITIPIVVGPYR